MWSMSIHWSEFVVRAMLVYVFMIVILRITGKRQVGQLAPFDLVLLLVLSNAVQNSMNGGDNSVVGGMISALTLVGMNWIVGYATFRSKWIERLIEGRPQVIIRDGHINRDVMRSALLTHHELEAALRRSGCAEVCDVAFAVLETNGQISVRPKEHDASVGAMGARTVTS
jgi:uncharacterized membrane protein YcaP (DUF421 family)